MKTLLLTLAAAGALLASPAWAQDDHAGHHPPADAAAAPKAMADMNDAEMHAHCQGLMGQKMKGRSRHDHSAEKLGHAPPPPTPPSNAEMKQMHETCAAMMAKGSAGLKSK
jgi:hypothetical protein